MALTRVQGSVKPDKIFNTIAEAKAVENAAVGDVIQTIGYTSANDGGGALYRVVDAATGTDDGGSYHDMTNGNQLELIDDHEDVIAKQFGVKSDGSSDDYAAIQAAINYADNAVGGGTGRYVKFPTGVSLISQRIIQPNRVGLKGPNGRGFILKPYTGFSDNEMISAENGTSSMFGALIKDMHINANGFNMTQVVRSVAHQETCGLERVVIQFDGTTRYGYYYEQGYGGAAYLPMKDIEIFSNSTYVSAAGIRVAQISVVGGFLLSVDGATITGSATNPIPAGIVMDNDSLYAKGVHVEYCNSAVTLSGAGSASIESLTGSGNQVTDLVTLGSGFTGRLSLRNIIPNGATGQILKNNITGNNIAASEGMLPNYNFELSGFSAYHSADQINVTGNSTEATAIFDTEIFDRRSEYNNATGIFTAKRQGKYLLSTCIKINPTLSVTSCFIKIVTSNRTYHIFRGDTDNIRDGSSTVTLNGCVIADMDVNDTAKVTVTCSGLAGDTIDILANESFFMGHWLER